MPTSATPEPTASLPEPTASAPEPAAVAEPAALAELARIDFAGTDLDQVLGLLADLAKRTIRAADEVSVTIVRGGVGGTPATTGDLALHADEHQYRLGYGPCLDAAATADVVAVDDMREEPRWPDYAPHAVESGVLSSISVGLPVQHELSGALNIYATKPNAFDDEARQLAQWLGGYAAVAVANSVRYTDATRLATQLREAMASRAVIEQAKGVLMALHRCDADAAFAQLTRASQHSHRKLRDIAVDIVERTSRAE